MAIAFSIDDLLAYTDWDRNQWHLWFREQDPKAFSVDLGPNNTGNIHNVGELVRHIFAAEKRYVERCLGLPLTDPSRISAENVETLFAFGQDSRRALRELLATFPQDRWEVPQEMSLGKHSIWITPRKMIAQAITHELRHWAQVAMLLRLDGRKPGMHDLLVSPVFDVPQPEKF